MISSFPVISTAWEWEGRRADLEGFRRDAGFTLWMKSFLCTLKSWWNVPLVKWLCLCNTHSNRSRSNRNSGEASAIRLHTLLVLCVYSTIVWHLWKEWKFTSWAYTRWTWCYHPRHCRWKRRTRPSEDPQDNCRTACSAITMLFPCLQSFSSKTSFLAFPQSRRGDDMHVRLLGEEFRRKE